MTVNERWIPFDGNRELELVEALSDREYAKSLKYNLDSDAPVANALLLDAEEPIALFCGTDGMSAEDEESLEAVAAEGVYEYWLWPASEIEMPELPHKAFKPAP